MTEELKDLYTSLELVKDRLPAGSDLCKFIEGKLEQHKNAIFKTKHLISNSGFEKYGNVFTGVYIAVFSSKAGDKEDKPLSDALWETENMLGNAIEEWELKYDKDFQKGVKEDQGEILGLFPAPIFYEEIPNEYAPSIPYYKAQPWLSVTTATGIFKIGRRKRVIEIDWSRTLCKTEAEVLFPDEDVTKGNYSIHAWNFESAKRYIETICKNIG